MSLPNCTDSSIGPANTTSSLGGLVSLCRLKYPRAMSYDLENRTSKIAV
jgi:hypothetical protein